MRAPSIRQSLLLRAGLGVGVLLALLAMAVYLQVERSLYRELDEALRETAALLSQQVELENGGITHEWQEGMGLNPQAHQSGLFQFWNDHQGTTIRSPNLSGDLPKYTGQDGRSLLRSILLPDGRHARALGVRVIPFVIPEEMKRMQERNEVIDPASLPHTLVVARDEEQLLYTLRRLRWTLLGGTVCALGLGFLVIDRVVRATLRPLDELAAEVRDRSEQRLDAALTVPGKLPRELTGLARDFDSLLARVAAIRQRERDFVRHAAHELRTPIAGLQATTELALSQPREAAAYAAHLATCQKTAVDLGALVQRLSALARIGQSTGLVQRERIDLPAFLKESRQSFTKAAEARGVLLGEPQGGPAVVQTDASLLRIIVNNLYDNAVSYTPEGGTVRITCHRSGERTELVFANPTAAFPEDPERLFEPLFRREASRHDSGAHLGIGLTLSRDAAQAIGGSLTARQGDEGWIEFVLELPPANPPEET